MTMDRRDSGERRAWMIEEFRAAQQQRRLRQRPAGETRTEAKGSGVADAAASTETKDPADGASVVETDAEE